MKKLLLITSLFIIGLMIFVTPIYAVDYITFELTITDNTTSHDLIYTPLDFSLEVINFVDEYGIVVDANVKTYTTSNYVFTYAKGSGNNYNLIVDNILYDYEIIFNYDENNLPENLSLIDGIINIDTYIFITEVPILVPPIDLSIRDILIMFYEIFDIEVISISLMVDITIILLVASIINIFIYIVTGFKRYFNKWVWVWITVFILAYLFKELGIIINILEVL